LEKELCKKCGVELPEGRKDKLCEECREKRKGFIKKVLIGFGVFSAAAVAAVLASSTSSDDNDYEYGDDHTGDDNGTAKQHPLLPAKSFLWLYDHWGEDAAQEVLDKVQNGEMSVEHVETCINRPDIDPKDWADFEDGWRPSGW